MPLQLLKHNGIVLLSNEKLGEFLYNLEGTALLPEACKIGVDENNLDPTKIKLIKSNRIDDANIIFRCFAGDKIEVKFLLPVINIQRENAIKTATELVNFF